jgi:hypothetical protein
LPGISHTFNVQAIDLGGANSPSWGTVIASTLATPDTTPPPAATVNYFKPVTSYGNMEFKFTTAATGDTAWYKIQRSTNGTTWTDDTGWTATFASTVITKVLGGGPYAAGQTVYARALVRDASLNVTTGASQSYVLIASPTTITADATNTHRNGQYNDAGTFRAYQGNPGGDLNGIGLWYYGTKPNTTLYYAGRRTIVSATMKFNRAVGGAEGAIAPVVKMHDQLTNPGTVVAAAPSLFGTETELSGSLLVGDTLFLALPAGWANDLVVGTHKGIAVFDTNGAPYGVWSSVGEYATSGSLVITHLG